MLSVVAGIEGGSIAEELELRVGDVLKSINGERVNDIVDYEALSANSRMLLVMERDGEEVEYEFEKDEDEPLGLRFAEDISSRPRECANKCLFCFVDQLPADARPSLRIKDDDWRMSLMFGSYVTLTNVSDAELKRIVARRATPLYISVHSTDMALRSRLLGTKLGAKLMDQLAFLARGGIRFHAQAVLCPGLNDGEALKKTVRDLKRLRPACLSLALVPVGLTGHREGLPDIKPFDRESARAAIAECVPGFVYAADELYLIAGLDVPPDDDYRDYPQLENGVGLMRSLKTEFDWALEDAELSLARPRRLIIATGEAAAPFMRDLTASAHLPGVSIDVLAIRNGFFGDSVNVAGLLTGGDLLRGLEGARADEILITECMLRDGEDVFLDGMKLNELQSRLGVKIVKVRRGGQALLDALMGIAEGN